MACGDGMMGWRPTADPDATELSLLDSARRQAHGAALDEARAEGAALETEFGYEFPPAPPESAATAASGEAQGGRESKEVSLEPKWHMTHILSR